MNRACWFVVIILSARTAYGQVTERVGVESITARDVERHINFLASDGLMGRDMQSAGLETAASYVADRFSAWGLVPAGDSGTYIQRWPFSDRRIDTAGISVQLIGRTTQMLKLGEHYAVIASAASFESAADSLTGDVVDAGSAAADMQPDPGLANKIVILHAPEIPGAAKALRAATNAVLRSGVRGLVVILGPDGAGQIRDGAASTAQQVARGAPPAPILVLRNDVGREWLNDRDLNPPQSGGPIRLAGVLLRLYMPMKGASGRPPNVIGVVKGADPALSGSYVVFSAHLDHIGIGPSVNGDSIYNGADDNASGMAAVLELAKAYGTLIEKPMRSVMFVVFSGEERGRRGSKYFVDHAPVPVSRMVANINLDMIGRNEQQTITALGNEYSSIGDLVQTVVHDHPELKMTIVPDVAPQQRLFFRGDHFSFVEHQVPAICLTSGLHADYHRPTDEPATIDHDKVARTAKLAFWIGRALANDTHSPIWTPAGLDTIRQGIH